MKRLSDHSWPIHTDREHGVTVFVYLCDSDQNGAELCCERRCSACFDEAGRPIIEAEPLEWHEVLP